MSLSSSHRRGGQPGNINALKHGFYTRRICKNHLSGLESTNNSGLADEIALIRIFTRRLVETTDPSADLYELADILRSICLASSTITRIIKAQAFLVKDSTGFREEVEEAIRRVRINLGLDKELESPDASPPNFESEESLSPVHEP